MEKQKQFSHDYYVTLKHIDMKKAQEYKESFIVKTAETGGIGIITPTLKQDDVDLTNPVVQSNETDNKMTDAEIEKANIDLMTKQLEEVKSKETVQDVVSAVASAPVATPVVAASNVVTTIKEQKALLLKNWVKNAKFLTDEQVIDKIKELWL